MFASLRESRLAERLGPVAVASGIVLVALGLVLEDSSVGLASAVRTLGGILFLCGLAAVLLANAHRRAVTMGIAKRIAAGYAARTASWGWPDRVGVAAMAIGLALIVPALVLQISFGNSLVVAAPAVILFWSGVGLLIYGRFYGRRAMRTREMPGASSSSRRERRGGARRR